MDDGVGFASECVARAVESMLISEWMREDEMPDLLYVLLHIPTKDNISIRLWSWDDIRLIILPMAHYILLDLWGSCQENLAARRIAFRIFDAFERACTITCAIEDKLDGGI